MKITVRCFQALIIVFFAATWSDRTTHAGSIDYEESWKLIRAELFDEAQIKDGAGLITLEAPKRAHDAATVPLRIRFRPDAEIAKVSLIIDENPVPLAGEFEFGPGAAGASFSTRVRVNAYSYVRAIAQTKTGELYMVQRFVKASGGCAAPATKDPEEAEASMGKMRLRLFTSEPAAENLSRGNVQEAQLMIRHPNHSGFQRDQLSLLYIPPHYVETIEIKRGDDLVMRVEGGISLSEDPNIRFSYDRSGSGDISVNVTDTEDQQFKKNWQNAGS